MALRLRLQRAGSRHKPVFRLVVAEALARRDGNHVEILATYHPQAKREEDEIIMKVDPDKVDYWIRCGAKPSDTAKTLVKRIQKMKEKGLFDKPDIAENEAGGASEAAEAQSSSAS